MNLILPTFLTLIIFMKRTTGSNKYDYYDDTMTVFEPPKNLKNGSYFGFSTAYYPYNNKLIISSPASDDLGSLYECDLNTKKCTDLKPGYDIVNYNYHHGFWFGATIAASDNYMISCAPRKISKYTSQNVNDFRSFGACYVRDKDSKTLKSKLKPTAVASVNTVKHNSAEVLGDSYGWTLHISPYLNHPVLVGGPAKYTGRVTRYETKTDTSPIVLIKYKDDRAKMNFGYSVTTGYFVSTTELSYVSGSPFGDNGAGRVYFYRVQGVSPKRLKEIEKCEQNNKDNKLNLICDDKLIGTLQIFNGKGYIEGPLGSRFGAVLCSVTLSDKGTDLLVGAPSYAEGLDYDLGAVYVYVAKLNNKLPEMKRLIKGRKVGGAFGSSIITIGDLNVDGKDEIAIAAPFEDNGVVYIYSGSDLLKNGPIKPLQTIQSNGYKSFGLSLAMLQDYDHNGCNELAIGAPFENKVMLLRCYVALKLIQTVEFLDIVQDRSHTANTNYTFNVCLIVKFPEKPQIIEADIKTEVTLTHSSAKLMNTNANNVFVFSTKIDRNQSEYCKSIPYYLPLVGRYNEPIVYEIKSDIVANKTASFDPTRVILAEDANGHVVQGTWWAVECTAASCKPILNLTITNNVKESPYSIGSSTIETVSVALHNVGLVAHRGGCVHVQVTGAHVASPPACVFHDVRTLKCALNNKLQPNSTWTTGNIAMDMRQLTNQDHSIVVKTWFSDLCANFYETTTPNATLTIPLVAIPKGIEIKAENNLGPLVNVTTVELKSVGTEMEHVYSISNNGQVNWEGLTCEVVVEKSRYIKYTNIMENFQLGMKCNSTETDEYLKATCKGISLSIGHKQKLVFVALHVLGSHEAGNFTVHSNFTLFVDNTSITDSVVTTIQVVQPLVALWVYVVAGVCGIILLAVVVVILYKCGCLRRKHKQSLEVMRESVKRQSMMGPSRPRSMVNPSKRDDATENMTNSSAVLLNDE